MSYGEYRATFRDYDEEKSTGAVPVTEIDEFNVASITAFLATFKTTLQAITIGILAAETIVGIIEPLLITLPSDAESQRELRWDAIYQDNVTNKKYKTNFGTANLDLLALNSPVIPGGNATYQDFETAFNALVVSQDGNPVTLIKVTQRGANL